jgi:hypothetical protein
VGAEKSAFRLSVAESDSEALYLGGKVIGYLSRDLKTYRPVHLLLKCKKRKVYYGVQKTATASSPEADELILLLHIPF